jgi:spermidine dehydrogenase
MYLPDGYCSWMSISDPLKVGSYRPSYKPEHPTILSMYKYLYKPGLDFNAQLVQNRVELEQKTFKEFEMEIRRELNHVFGAWGFDAGRDILGIQINRWGHGYNFFKAPSMSEAYKEGRQKLGRISFAGADAGGEPWMQSGLQQAWRAAHEQL